MKIRLMGTEDECREVATLLPALVDVLEVSGPKANRGASQQVRVYVEARLYREPPPPVQRVTAATGPARRAGQRALAQRMPRRRALPGGGE